MKGTYKVVLSSDHYGDSVFEHDTLKEAKACFKRLVDSSERFTLTDGVERTVTLTIYATETRKTTRPLFSSRKLKKEV